MKVLSWNIRGLGQARKQNGLGGVLRDNGVKVCGIFETKCGGLEMRDVVNRAAPGWEFATNFELDHRGCIMVLWDQSFTDVQVVGVSKQHMGCTIVCKETGKKYGVCFVYGLHSVVERREIWDHVGGLLEAIQLPWIIMGDFNCVKAADERINGAPVSMYECSDLVDACTRLGLVDTPFTSTNKFTWTNGVVWSRIDRVMVNPMWMELEIYCHTAFPDVWQLSDHKPAIVSLRRMEAGGRRYFKFFNMWAAHPEFGGIVREHWQTHAQGSYQFRLSKLLYGMKGPLKGLNSREFSHISSRVDVANKELENVLEELRLNPGNLEIHGRMERAKASARRLNDAEASFLSQLAKAKFTLNSDRCSKYFHALMRANARRGHVASITKADGDTSSSLEEVANELQRVVWHG